MARADGDVRARTLEWLEPRLPRVPGELGRAVRRCVRRTAAGADEPDDTVPALLARCAVEELDRIRDRPGGREVAVRLLAADASLTWAFEAAGELGEDVPALADRVGLSGALGRRLAPAGEGPGGAEGADGGGRSG